MGLLEPWHIIIILGIFFGIPGAIIGYYKKRQVSDLTILSSKLWEVAVFVLFGLHVTDIDCGFKLISKKVQKPNL